jgi:hypothetical protein
MRRALALEQESVPQLALWQVEERVQRLEQVWVVERGLQRI